MDEEKLRKYNIMLATGIILLVACFAVGAVFFYKAFINLQKNIVGIIGPESNSKEYIYALYEPLKEEYITAGGEILEQLGLADYTLLRNNAGKTLLIFIIALVVIQVGNVAIICTVLIRIKAEYRKVYQEQEKKLYDLKKELSQIHYLQERNVQMQCFIENIAHQIKTPISRVSTTLEIIQDNVEDETAIHRIEECFEHLDTVRVLMKRLTDIGCLEAGKVVFRKEIINLNELFMDVLFAVGCEEESAIIDVSEDIKVFGDYEWLKEAFVNICGNAIEHDRSGKPLEIKCSLSNENVHLTIRDHGVGVDERDTAYLFDRFYSPKNIKKGHTGIGLNLAKLIIDNHNGNIHISNHEKQGTIVNIVIPNYPLKEGKI